VIGLDSRGDSSYIWLAVLFIYVTSVFIVLRFSVFYSFIYIFGFLVSKLWLMWIFAKQRVTNWGLPVIRSGVWYYTVTGWMFSNIWKERTKPCTQWHWITSKHTRILHPLFFWAVYHYFDILIFWFLQTKHLAKVMIKTNINISHFELFVVSDAS